MADEASRASGAAPDGRANLQLLRRFRKLALVAVSGLAALAAALALWPPRQPDADEPADPRLTLPTRYRNVHPAVKYVGSAACNACHAGDLVDHYHQHPMGKSLAPTAEASNLERYKAGNPFRANGLEYFVEHTPAGVIHHERLRDASGNVLFDAAETITYAIGSGAHGRSYLIERGNQLFQSPISWYSAEARWDLSPGYASNNQHFDRLVPGGCVFCHANLTEPRPGKNNSYFEPIFRGHAIGCERCHGPGELHVRRHEDGESFTRPDDTIVNPHHLDAALRDDVCAQCHLQGQERVQRRGRELYDYRPGLPLTAFQVVFVRHPDAVDYQLSVGQFEQLRMSRCAQASGGALGCISCHDPHRKPSREEAAAFFRGRCQACHGAAKPDCAAPLPERQAKNGNSCIACHMPRNSSSNIAHTSVTDHRIPRRPAERPAGKKGLPPGELALLAFDAVRLADDPELERDLGVALANLADTVNNRAPALQAHARLYAALERHPRDWDALEAHALSLMWQRDGDRAAAAITRVLEQFPRRESALAYAARIAWLRSRLDEEAGFLKRLNDVNPNYALYWTRLAEVRAQQGQWAEARGAAERALALSPARRPPRRVLLEALAKLGDPKQVPQHLAIYEALGAEDAAEVRRWFFKE